MISIITVIVIVTIIAIIIIVVVIVVLVAIIIIIIILFFPIQRCSTWYKMGEGAKLEARCFTGERRTVELTQAVPMLAPHFE